MNSYPPWLRVVPWAITPFTSGVCFCDVVKGHQTEIQRYVTYTWGKLSEHEALNEHVSIQRQISNMFLSPQLSSSSLSQLTLRIPILYYSNHLKCSFAYFYDSFPFHISVHSFNESFLASYYMPGSVRLYVTCSTKHFT